MRQHQRLQLTMDLRASLGARKHDDLMRGVASGKYHVLLGAGASAGGSSRDGRPLPMAEDLTEELSATFGLPSPGAGGLRRLYALARQRQPTELAEYMQLRFTGTSAPGWMNHLVGLPWAQLWTLNVDDAVQQAYSSPSARQQLLSISWTERHRTARPSLSELLLIHLHGKASRAHRPDEIVFDISGYVNAAQAQHRWHRIFGDVYPEEPFLIVGASLDSEIDLEAVLSQGHLRASAEHPSIIVLRDVTSFQIEEYKGYGLDLIQGTADDFFSAIAAEYQEYLSRLTSDEALQATELPREALSFLTQWQRLELGAPGRVDRRHDYLAGHEPEWEDVLEARVMERDAVSDLVTRLTGPLSGGTAYIGLVEAEPFTGKSSLLLTLARRLADLDYKPFIYAGSSAPDIDAALWWLRRYPRSVLLLDDAADFARDIEVLRERVSTNQAVARVLMVERSGRARHIHRTLMPGALTSIVLGARLSDAEIRRMLEVLRTKRRLGVITGLNAARQFDFFARVHERELFSAMAALEAGRGFVDRIASEYEAHDTPQDRLLLGVLSICAWLGYGLPVTLAKAAVGSTAKELEDRLGASTLGDLAVIRRGRVHLRHKIFGSVVISSELLSFPERFQFSVALAKALGPHISPATITASTYNYRITRALMGQAALSQLLGGRRERVLDFYDAIEPEFEWNARFWEQRALSAADAGLFEPAYSWAQQAVIRRRDAFTLNTVGTVLMKRALSEARSGSWPTDTFEAAVESLEEARAIEGSDAEYPYETFFTYTLRLVQQAGPQDAALNAQVQYLWNSWYTRQLGLAEGPRRRIELDMQQTFRDWQRLSS